MKSIRQDIVTKEAGIDLFLRVSMDGEPIVHRQADSLVGNFGRVLAGMMGQNSSDAAGRYLPRSNNRNFAEVGGSQYGDIDGITYGSPGEINWGYDTDVYWENNNNEGLIYLDAQDDIISGLYYGVGHNTTTFYEPVLDRENGTASAGANADWSGTGSANWNEKVWWSTFEFITTNRDQSWFEDPRIILGKNVPNKDAEIEDWWLENFIRRFDATETTISTPAVQTFQSEITLSRTFTNNKSYDIDVGEIGVIGGTRRDNERFLMARDNVANFTIASGKSVTVDYVFKITNGGGGGVMAQFHQQLYRQFTRNNRVVRDLDNSDRNDGDAPGQWIAAATGGNCDQERSGNGQDGQYVGPVVGTDATEVSNTNTSLLNQVPHGETDGDLFYYGSAIEKIITDKANDELYFDISRLCENRGSTTIAIKESALYTGYNSDDYEDDRLQYSSIQARHILGTSVDIAPGEVIKITYRLKVVV